MTMRVLLCVLMAAERQPFDFEPIPYVLRSDSIAAHHKKYCAAK